RVARRSRGGRVVSAHRRVRRHRRRAAPSRLERPGGPRPGARRERHGRGGLFGILRRAPGCRRRRARHIVCRGGRMSRFWGNLYLAYRALAARPLKRLLRGEGGIERFYENYGPEGLIPTTAQDRAMLTAAGRCIACGLCDAFDGNLSRMDRSVYDGASLLPRQWARTSVDLPHARRALSRLRPAELEEAQ